MSAISAPEPFTGQGPTAEPPNASARLCHDLRQYVAAGLLLSTSSSGPMDLIHQQFTAIAELLDAESGAGHTTGAVSLTRLVSECADVVRLTHRVPVVTEWSTHVLVHGDQAMLRRAVGNMLDNACRAAGAGGTVTVRVQANDEGAAIEVRDDGPGFGAVSSGTGHGLQSVAAAVRACQGRLEISSGPDAGTSVRLLLPVLRRPVRPA